MKIAPKMGPRMVPRPPMTTMDTTWMETTKAKSEAEMKPMRWA